jgi:cytochrome c oxidase subunit IV
MTMSTTTTALDEQHTPGHSAGGEHPGGTHEGASDFTYIKIALALMVLTGAEIAVNYLDIGKFQVPLLLVMMFVKFFTVVLYFMHLKFDNVLFKRLFYTGLFLAILVYVAMLTTFHYFA